MRYSQGSMPTSYGFTGQRSDPSGLAYYHARYYDPTVGAFISADAVQGPNRYGYVKGNPETMNDPTGNNGNCAESASGFGSRESVGSCGGGGSDSGGGGGGGNGGSGNGGSGSGDGKPGSSGKNGNNGGGNPNDPILNAIVGFLQSKGYTLADIWKSLNWIREALEKHTGLTICGGFWGGNCGGNFVSFCVFRYCPAWQKFIGQEYTKDQLKQQAGVFTEMASLLGVIALGSAFLGVIPGLIMGVVAAKIGWMAWEFSNEANNFFTASRYVIVDIGPSLLGIDVNFFQDNEIYCYPDMNDIKQCL